MNRDEAKQLTDKHSFKEAGTTGRYIIPRRVVYIIIDSLSEGIESIKKENIRLKKQLSKDHHIECSCSFCKPVGEKQSCENCRHYDGTQTCNKFVARSSYNYKDFCCNKWELKC